MDSESYSSSDSSPTKSMDSEPRSVGMLTWFVLLAQALGISVVILVAYWLGHYHEGFAWTENPRQEFNYHPLFMVIGFVYLYGNAIMIFRIFPQEKKIYIKVLHLCLQAAVIIFVAVGLRAVLDSHNLPNPQTPNFYSIHSWLGLATMGLFGLQFIFGFTSYLWPMLSLNARIFYMPIHRFWGVAIFTIALGTALIGVCEKAIFSVSNYSGLGPEAVLVNVFGVTVVAFGLCVGYIVTNENYKRPSNN